MRAAMGMHGVYLIQDAAGDPFEKVPELSRRGRAIPVWAVLRALGRSGVAGLVDGFARHATAFADGVRAIEGAEVSEGRGVLAKSACRSAATSGPAPSWPACSPTAPPG